MEYSLMIKLYEKKHINLAKKLLSDERGSSDA